MSHTAPSLGNVTLTGARWFILLPARTLLTAQGTGKNSPRDAASKGAQVAVSRGVKASEVAPVVTLAREKVAPLRRISSEFKLQRISFGIHAMSSYFQYDIILS